MKHSSRNLVAAAMALCSLGAAANEAQKIMMQLPSDKQDVALIHVITSADEPCDKVTRKFFQGSDKRGNAFWNASCSNGKSFVVMFKNDALGSTSVLDCGVMKVAGGQRCFTKF